MDDKKVCWYKLQCAKKSILVSPKSITKMIFPKNGSATVMLNDFMYGYEADSIIAVDELGQELAIIFSANYRIEDFSEEDFTGKDF